MYMYNMSVTYSYNLTFSPFRTAFYVLGLIASTSKGAGILNDFGWETIRHKRSDWWPVIEESDKLGDDVSDLASVSSSASLNSNPGSKVTGTTRGSATPSLLQALFTPPDQDTQGVEPSTPTSFYIDAEEEAGRKSRSSTEDEAGHKSRSSTLDSGDMSDSKHRSDISTGSTPPTNTNMHSLSSPPPNNLSTHNNSAKSSSDTRDNSFTQHQAAEPVTSDSESFITPPSTLTKGSRSDSAPPIRRSQETVHQRSQSDPLTNKSPVNVVVHFEDSNGIDYHTGEPAVRDAKSPSYPSHKPGAIQTDNTSTVIGSESVERHVSSGSEGMLHQRSAMIGRTSISGGFRDERSGSNESSRTSKSRSDSMNTDITTSGISSYESAGAQGVNDHQQLSPIPSASSMTAQDVSVRGTVLFPDADKSSVHPSDTLRRLVNLKRVPSMKRRYSNPSLVNLSPHKHSLEGNPRHSESMILYTSSRDLQGYAALRELQRQVRHILRSLAKQGDDALSSVCLSVCMFVIGQVQMLKIMFGNHCLLPFIFL